MKAIWAAVLAALAVSAAAKSPDTVTTPPATLEGLLASRPIIRQSLTMEQAVEIALRESPMVRGAVAEVDVAVARLRAARAERKPWVSTSAFLSTGNSENILAASPITQPQSLMIAPRGNFGDLNVSAMLPLYTGGRLEAMAWQAVALRSASEAELAAQRQEVALMVRMAYREIQAMRAMAAVQRARLEANQERLRQDRTRLQQESIPAYYVQRSEAEVAMTQQELTNAERDVELALVQMKTVMGIHPTSEIDVAGALDEPSAESAVAGTDPADLPALMRLAETGRPELQAALDRVRGAEAEIGMVRGGYAPQVNVSLMGDLMKMESESARTGSTAAIVASFHLYSGGQRGARIAGARAMREREERMRQQTALRVAQEVSNASLSLRAARQNVETARTGLTAAQAEFGAANMRYQVGRSTVIESLDALAIRTRAESEVVNALFQYDVARDRLLRAIGRLERPTLSTRVGEGESE